MKAVVRLHRDDSRGRTLLAFADLRVGDFEIRGLRVFEGKAGPYVAFPMRPSGYAVVRPLTPKARDQAKEAVLRAYKRLSKSLA